MSARVLPLLAGLALTALACAPPGPPPYGLDTQPRQRFRFEAEETVEVDGQPATIRRYADFEVRARHDDTTQVELFLERYHTRVDGAPGGATELTISDRGLTTVTPLEGSQHLGPDAAGPWGGTIGQLRQLPVAGVELASNGALADDLWQSTNPVLFGVHLLDWWLLALPVQPGGSPLTWTGSRELPQIGQYRIGVELPLHFRQDQEGRNAVQSTGNVERAKLRIATGFEGALRLSHLGHSQLAEDRSLLEATVELRMTFESTRQERVESVHRVRIRRLQGDQPVNPCAEGADTTSET